MWTACGSQWTRRWREVDSNPRSPVRRTTLFETPLSQHARATAAFENARRAVQQLLLPVVDLVRMNPELTRQLGDRPVPLDRRQRHLRLERRVVLLPCPF